ncbi:hypothetical protein [Alteromonas sp. a30]|nr:hypothetical protein [Alteromonas sp. a30]MCY7297246.1 hypothetical protein [Alteromonas sp. a30]
MEPDYSKYNIYELHEALDAIDRSAYPDRVKRILSQLEQRESTLEPVTQEEAITAGKNDIGIKEQIILAVVALFFSWLVFDALSTGEISGKRNNYTYETSPKMFLFLLAVDILIVGICLYRISKAKRVSQQ